MPAVSISMFSSRLDDTAFELVDCAVRVDHGARVGGRTRPAAGGRPRRPRLRRRRRYTRPCSCSGKTDPAVMSRRRTAVRVSVRRGGRNARRLSVLSRRTEPTPDIQPGPFRLARQARPSRTRSRRRSRSRRARATTRFVPEFPRSVGVRCDLRENCRPARGCGYQPQAV